MRYHNLDQSSLQHAVICCPMSSCATCPYSAIIFRHRQRNGLRPPGLVIVVLGQANDKTGYESISRIENLPLTSPISVLEHSYRLVKSSKIAHAARWILATISLWRQTSSVFHLRPYLLRHSKLSGKLSFSRAIPQQKWDIRCLTFKWRLYQI